MTDVDAGEYGELRQQRRDRIRPGMDRARKRDRLSCKLLPVDRGVGIGRGGIRSGLDLATAPTAGKPAPAAPNPLTKLRRLVGTPPLPRVSAWRHVGAPNRGQSIHNKGYVIRDIVAPPNWRFWRRCSVASRMAGSRSPARTCHAIVPATLRSDVRRRSTANVSPCPGYYLRWFARPLILAVAVLMALFAATSLLGLQILGGAASGSSLHRAQPPGARNARSAAGDRRGTGDRKARVSHDPRPRLSQGLRRL